MQSDLFEIPSDISGAAREGVKKLAFLEGYRLSFRLDQTLGILIALIVFYAFIFSFGVEKGKQFAFAELKAERAKRERMVRELREKLVEKFFPSPPVRNIPNLKSSMNLPIESMPSAVPPQSGGSEKSAAPSPVPNGYPLGKYTIQIITYNSSSAADRAIADLSGKGLRGFVIPSGVHLQVCVDGFENHQKAQQALEKLKSRGLVPPDAFVRLIPQ
jgi:hypothetical protein